MNNAKSYRDSPLQTEGIKYAGSKLKLIPQILEMIQSLPVDRVFDGFAGTTRVSQALAKSGYQVTTNDIAVWSKVFSTCYLKNQSPPGSYQDLIDHLNGLNPVDGWFTENYGGVSNGPSAIQTDGLKRPWQIHNTRRLDSIRQEIDRLELPDIEKAVALTSLILAMDKVDNTVGHYVSYLKKWSPRSFNTLELKVPQLALNPRQHRVMHSNVFEAIKDVDCDLAYFDPPYGSNNEKMPPSRVRYASYYHLWTTICLNDQPELVGKSRRRTDCSDSIATSVFEEFRRNPDSGQFLAVEAIQKLIVSTPARWQLFSYNNAGRATSQELRDVFDAAGKVIDVRETDYRRNVMSAMRWTDDWIRPNEGANREFLFLLEKT